MLYKYGLKFTIPVDIEAKTEAESLAILKILDSILAKAIKPSVDDLIKALKRSLIKSV